MLVSLKWLRDYVEINDDIKDYCDKMTMTGSKVETFKEQGDGIKKVVVGKILEITRHPDAEKLVVTKTDIGEEVLQIVTGATNLKVGDYVPVAQVGAWLPGGIKIKRGKLRGETSEGMLCSAEELEIPKKFIAEELHDGIYILDKEYPLGSDIREIMGLNDYVVEFEITSNRPDCLSMLGIARESAVTLNVPVKLPEIKVNESDEAIAVDVKVEDAKLCQRYTARVIKDIKIAPSPYWMQRRLIEANIRPINNIVDITNYVMIEMGQPLHAFDLRDIEGNSIVVKRANDLKQFTTLDEVERNLNEDMLMIWDAKKPVAIAGVMGGLNSEVKDDTTEILLESANFNSDSVRSTSKILGLRTEASSRFEKGVDANLTLMAVDRACQLIEEIGAGRVLKASVDVKGELKENKQVLVRPKRISRLLGVDLSAKDIREILERLEFKCELKGEELIVQAPSYRLDVEQEADILEEVARIYGYTEIPVVMSSSVHGAGGKYPKRKFEDKAKEVLRTMGTNEILTYSFVSPKSVDKINAPANSPLRDMMALENALGEETSVMRRTLLANLLEVMSYNNLRKVDSFAGFEVGNTFIPRKDEILPEEKKSMVVGVYGKEEDFFSLKGRVENLLEMMGLENIEFVPEKNNGTFHPGRCAKIELEGKEIGILGEIHPIVKENFGMKAKAYVAELDFEAIYEMSNKEVKYQAIPKHPAMERDLALVIEDRVYVSQVEALIKNNGGKLLESVQLFDVYKGDQIQEGYKSVAYSLKYRAKDRTLTDEEVNKVQTKILEQLKSELGAELR